MKQMILVISVLGLVACGSKSSDSSSEKGAENPGGLKKVTSSTECRSGLPATQLAGAWNTVFRAPQITMNMTFDFNNNGVFQLANECVMPPGTLTSYLSTNYSDNGSQITFAKNVSHEEKRNQMTCTASIQKGTVNYAFEGSCLVMTDPAGAKLYLTHAY